MTYRNYMGFLLIASSLLMVACAGGSGDPQPLGRIVNMHEELNLSDKDSAGNALSINALDFQAQLINIGAIYLETQMAPMSGTVALQASDISVNGTSGYISYSSYESTGESKVGGVEQVQTYNCDNALTLTHTEYCMSSIGTMSFPTTDIFATVSDGTNLYATGSTSVEDQPTFARLFKISLDTNKSMTSIAATKVLDSYAGTGIVTNGSTVLATYGTSTDPTKKGGMIVMNSSDLSTVATQSLYDARSLAIDPSNTAKVLVTRGALDGSNPGALVEYNSNGSGSALSTIASGGNTIAESKSNIMIGSSLILASLGPAGFKVYCRSNGTQLASVGAVSVAGITAAKTVTNSVLALPGYIFAANGEAGIYVYTFKKSNILNSNYCQGVSLSLVGRLTLAASSTYVNVELSANSLRYIPTFNLLNILTAKNILVASGNKGVSLLNISSLSLALDDVNDF